MQSKKEYAIRTAEKILMMAARSGGIAIVSAVLLILISGRITSTAERIMKARGDLASFTKKYELFDQIKKDHSALADKTPKLESALPSPDNLPAIADYFGALEPKTNNIITTRFSREVRVNALGLNEISFATRALGTPQSITDLLAAMENAPYFIKINNVSLSSADNMRQTELNAAGVVYLKQNED